MNSLTDSSCVSPDVQCTLQLTGESDIAYKCEVNALRTEIRHCNEQVEKLSREFVEIKREIEAARREVDNTWTALSEVTTKLLSTD